MFYDSFDAKEWCLFRKENNPFVDLFNEHHLAVIDEVSPQPGGRSDRLLDSLSVNNF